MRLKILRLIGLIVCILILSMVSSPCLNASQATSTLGDDILSDVANTPVLGNNSNSSNENNYNSVS